MKTKLGVLSVILITGLLVSCVTGDYMAMKSKEQADVLGTVQSTFIITGAFRYRRVINRQAYISLLAEAQNKYPDFIVDVRDISWAIGQGDAPNNNYEYSAIGKVIRLPKNN
jgi:hypothetical protein